MQPSLSQQLWKRKSSNLLIQELEIWQAYPLVIEESGKFGEQSTPEYQGEESEASKAEQYEETVLNLEPAPVEQAPSATEIAQVIEDPAKGDAKESKDVVVLPQGTLDTPKNDESGSAAESAIPATKEPSIQEPSAAELSFDIQDGATKLEDEAIPVEPLVEEAVIPSTQGSTEEDIPATQPVANSRGRLF